MENVICTPEGYTDRIRQVLGNCLIETNHSQGEKSIGKVRDRYDLGDRLALITTDRQSAFDRVLAAIPFKGQVLNLTSAWWFEQTRHIVPNHVLSIPDPNVTIAKQCIVFPIEFVVRGYITGTTSTALWTVYQSGQRELLRNRFARRPREKPEAPVELPHTDHQGGGSRPSDQPRRDCVRKLDDGRGLEKMQPHRAGTFRIRSSQGSRAWPDSRGYKI